MKVLFNMSLFLILTVFFNTFRDTVKKSDAAEAVRCLIKTSTADLLISVLIIVCFIDCVEPPAAFILMKWSACAMCIRLCSGQRLLLTLSPIRQAAGEPTGSFVPGSRGFKHLRSRCVSNPGSCVTRIKKRPTLSFCLPQVPIKVPGDKWAVQLRQRPEVEAELIVSVEFTLIFNYNQTHQKIIWQLCD